jgi:multiple sugar transport system substrate-binding protein
VTLRWLLVAAALSGCGGSSQSEPTVIRFWGMGREGEVVEELVTEFEREHPNIRVRVQQIPWSAAHEKLLTGFVGRSTPDIAQLGNTWVSEFSAIEALEPLDTYVAASPTLHADNYFPGIWDTNVIDGVSYGIPWYVDTRLLFYRKDILAEAGYDTIPHTWDGWVESMEAVKRVVGPDNFAILAPVNEWTMPVVLGLQAGSPLVKDNVTVGDFSGPEFKRAFRFYLDLFDKKLAPPVSNNEIANVYQEFGRGYFSMYITGPWNIGEFDRRLPPEMKDKWGTSPLPGPTGRESGVSLAGGSSLVLFKGSKHKKEAWQLVEFLSRPDVQVRFFKLTGDLPARTEAWTDTAVVNDTRLAAFGDQLRYVAPTPKTPEWELIAARLQEKAETAIRGAAPPDTVLADLDRDVDRILKKRRWMLEQKKKLAADHAEVKP